jgi:hypothetical protein
MPVQSCSDNGKPGYKWGEQGACYTYPQGNLVQQKKAKKKAFYQGLAIGEASNFKKLDDVDFDENKLDDVLKSLTEWFKEKWVDISRPKAGGGFEPCGRNDAKTGKYPKCVPAARAAKMSPEQIASAVRRKRTAESTQTRDGKKPINVPTEKAASVNVPTDPALYARVKAEAKAKFNIYPSAYANAWLVREYKKRGGGYRTVSKDDSLTDLIKSEDMINGYPAATQDISVNIANRQDCIDIANYGPMNPAIDNIPFWQAKADIFNTTIDEAKTARCGNCAAFIQTTDMKEAIASGLGGEEDAYAVINLANLGYCEIFDFKCAATRTCDAWVVGGPLTDNNFNVTKFDLLRYIIEGLSPFETDSINKEIK